MPRTFAQGELPRVNNKFGVAGVVARIAKTPSVSSERTFETPSTTPSATSVATSGNTNHTVYTRDSLSSYAPSPNPSVSTYVGYQKGQCIWALINFHKSFTSWWPAVVMEVVFSFLSPHLKRNTADTNTNITSQ
jgi:hypothetical protein